MNSRSRVKHIAWVVVLFGVMAMTATAYAGQARGLGTDPRQGSTSAVPRYRGFSDFGLSYTPSAVLRAAPETTSQPVGAAPSDGFHWRDAGIGAGLTLALVLIAGAGVATIVTVRSRRGDYRSA